MTDAPTAMRAQSAFLPTLARFGLPWYAVIAYDEVVVVELAR
jgi:hypothetical protein